MNNFDFFEVVMYSISTFLIGLLIGAMIFGSSDSDITSELEKVKEERDTYKNLIVQKSLEE